MNPNEEMLAAYVDGELDPAGRLQVEQAIARDPAVAAKVASLRELTQKLIGAHAAVLSEPVPAQLLAAARGPHRAAVVDLAAARAATQPRAKRRWSVPEWGAIAAGVVVGVFAGYFGLGSRTPDLVAVSADGITAGRALAQALSNQLAADGRSAEGFAVQLTFRAKDGEYCRTFAVSQRAVTAGVACREGEQWRVRVLSEGAPSHAESSGYRLAAATLPSTVLDKVQATIAGEPLDAVAEAAARQSGWR